MSDQTEALQKIFRERMALIAEISKLNAEQLHNTQRLSGNQIELMRCVESAGAQAVSEQANCELAEAAARDAHLKSKIVQCNEQLQALEEQVAVVDRKLDSL